MTAMLGILGGMGPAATVDIVRKILALTPARRDQDHFPLLIYSNPQIPDRSAYLMGQGESPLPALVEGMHLLTRSGAQCIVIPCNTAHYWFEKLARETSATMIHIAHATLQSLAGRGALKRIGIMATDGTLKAGFYQQILAEHGYEVVSPGGSVQADIMGGIRAVKAGQIPAGASLLEKAAQVLLAQGADHLILACTEIPVALDSVQSPVLAQCEDSSHALAKACVQWLEQHTLEAEPADCRSQ